MLTGSADSFKHNIDKIFEYTIINKECYIITREFKNIAVLLPIEFYEKLLREAEML